MTLRWYQVNAVQSVFDYFREKDGSPCVVLPTGSGKTHVIAELCRQTVAWGGRALVLAHVKELLEQSRVALSSARNDRRLFRRSERTDDGRAGNRRGNSKRLSARGGARSVLSDRRRRGASHSAGRVRTVPPIPRRRTDGQPESAPRGTHRDPVPTRLRLDHSGPR